MGALRHDAATGGGLAPRAGESRVFVARAARTGEHRYGAGERGGPPAGVERRDAAELRRIVSQLGGRPLTLGHPRGMIANGAAARVVGRVQRSWVDGEFAMAEIRVDDATAMAAIRTGAARELSLGYSTNADRDGFQRDTAVDHLALVPAGRCGSECAVRADQKKGGCGCGCTGEKAPILTERADRDTLAEQARAMAHYRRTLATR